MALLLGECFDSIGQGPGVVLEVAGGLGEDVLAQLDGALSEDLLQVVGRHTEESCSETLEWKRGLDIDS